MGKRLSMSRCNVLKKSFHIMGFDKSSKEPLY